MPNELGIGESRTGQLFDGDESTPHVTVTLTRTEDSISLALPWIDPQSPYSRWFAASIEFGDDPDRTKYAYSPPSELSFRDSKGSVTLLGCRATGMTSNFQQGTGRVSARRAVLGANPSDSYRKVHGIRGTVSGLREWTGISSITSAQLIPESGSGRQVAKTYRLEAAPTQSIPGSSPLHLRPTWRTSQDGDTAELHDELLVEHNSPAALTWEEARDRLVSMRDLIAISRWTPETLTITHVSNRSASGASVSEGGTIAKWLQVVEAVPAETAPRLQSPHLITFSEIGLAGLGGWIKLRHDFHRAIAPAISSIFMRAATIEVQLSQIGIGLEALGFLVAQHEHAMTPERANKLRFQARLELIQPKIESVLPFASKTWPARAANAYNAVKHANRQLPPPVDLANTWREMVQVFRCWIALSLGVNAETLKDRVGSDRLSFPFIEDV